MKTSRYTLRLAATALFALAASTGCESTGDGGSSNVSSSVYYGVGIYDPWYYGGCCYDDIHPPPPPPPGGGGAHPSHPIATPPGGGGGASARPMPSIPSAPRVSGRGR